MREYWDRAKPILRRGLNKALPILKLGTKFVPLIPTGEDTWPQRVAKCIALLDATKEVLDGQAMTKLRAIKEKYSLVETESETFVRLFFSTTLRDMFTLHREALDEYEDLIEAVGTDGERLFFRESNNFGLKEGFYATPETDFERIVDRLWTDYPDGIFLSITQAQGWKKETTLCEVPPVPIERLCRVAKERLKRAVEVHRGFMLDGTHRCYLAYGPPGTGKSSFAVLFAREFGGRALKIDATSLPIVNVKEFGFLIDTLRPSFLILDDIDRADVAQVEARILFLLERLKTHYPKMTVILTANEPSKLGSALLRCGRIDVPWKFTAPEPDEMDMMLLGLMQAHSVPAGRATAEARTKIREIGSELTHAYLDDLCRRLRHEEIDDVLESVLLLKSLADSAGSGGPSTPNGTKANGPPVGSLPTKG